MPPRLPATVVRRWPLLAGITLVALNLRPALASVGPLVPDIRAATGLSNAALGTLTTLPLVAFGCVSLLTATVTRRVGSEAAVVVALVLLTSGIALRATPSIAALYLGTGILGVGIALGNVLLPALAKRDFADQLGPITSLYSGMMGVGAMTAAGISVPLATTLGWRGALGIWTIPAVLAIVAWLPQLSGRRPAGRGSARVVTLGFLGRSKLAWQVALYMGLQSFTFYVILAWLPDLLQSRGSTDITAGWLLSLSQATGVLGTTVIPFWAGRVVDQRRIIGTLAVLESVGLGGLLLPGGALATLWVSVLGLSLGGSFGLALTFLVLRAPDAESAGELSGMAQSVGYLVAATGPTVVGYLYDASSGWTVPLLFLLGVLGTKVLFGLPAGREGLIGDTTDPPEQALTPS